MHSPSLEAAHAIRAVQPAQLVSALIAATLLYVLYHVGIGVYNLYFHPLAGYPGPLLCRASSLWYARSLSRGRIAQDTLALHDYYGPVVRIAPDELSYINPDNWKEIYAVKPGKGELIKDPRYHDTVKPTPTILTGDWEEHSKYRKMLSPTFSERTLKEQEYILHQYVNLFIKRLYEVSDHGEKKLDMTAWWNYLTFDIIGFLAYGEAFNCLTESKLHDWIEALLDIAVLMSLGQAARHLPAPFDKIYKKWVIPASVRRNAQLHRDLTEEKLQRRLEKEPGHQDVIKRMVASYKTGEVPYPVLKEHAGILTIGGSETTATLLAGATFYLAKNPAVALKLAAELRARFGRDEDITVAGTQECPYLVACVEEALRIYPPSPANHTRITPPEGIILDGRYVPGGFAVGMPMYACFRSAANFRNPATFAPERWLPTAQADGSEYAGDRRNALQPFSVGPRNCLGRALAYQEMKFALAKLLWHFDLELRPESKDWIDQKNYTFWVKPELWIKLTPARKDWTSFG